MKTPSALDTAVEQYVKLVLAVGQHDANYVDAYYGPEAWAAEAKASPLPLPELAARAAALVKTVEAVPVPEDALVAMRRRFLLTQVSSLGARVRMLSGEKLKFDEESEALYGTRAPRHTEAQFEEVIAQLEKFQLPAHERFTLEYVTQKPWGGYNWFKGSAMSVIQVNTDLPIYILRAIDLAAHEGYPGHHVYNALLEQHLVRGRGWVEFAVPTTASTWPSRTRGPTHATCSSPWLAWTRSARMTTCAWRR
jgi:hypothetical protein